MASALDVLKQQTANGNGMKVSGSNGTSSSGKTNPEQAQQQMSSGLAALTGSYKPNGNGMRIGQDIPTATQYRAAQQTAYDRYKQQLSAATTSAQQTMEDEKAKTNWFQRTFNTAGASDYFAAKNAYTAAANEEAAFNQYVTMQGGKNTGMSIAQLEAQSKAKLEEAQTALRNAEMGYATGSLSPMGAVAAARYSKSQNASLQADVDQAQAAYDYYHSVIEQQNAEARETAKSDAFNTGYSQYRSEQESAGVSTQEAYSSAKSNRDSAQASYNEAKKAYEREQRNQRAAIQYGLPYDASQLDRAKADMDSAKAALDDAETRVSYADKYSMDGVNLNPDFAKVSAQGTAQFEADLRSERLQRVIDNSSSVQMELETGMATEDDIYQRYYGNGETSDHYGDKSSYYESGRAEDYSPTRYADEWSDAEKQKFGYLYATDKEAAYRYGRSVNAAIITKHNAEADKKTAAWATENFVSGTLASGSSLAASTYGALFEYEDMLGQYLGSGDIMAKEGSVTQYSNAVQTAIASDLNAQYGTIDSSLPVIGGKGLGDLYQIGMSSAQSSLSATTLGSAGTMVSFFGQAAAQGVYDAINRGATPDQAIMLGTLNGIMEGVGEALSVEYFLGPVMEGLGQELSQQILRTLIQGGIEASEEGFTTLLNTFCDHLVMGDKSELNQNIASYKELGYSDEEARKLAFKDWWSGIAWDMVAGFGSGFGMGAVSTIGHNLSANLTAYNTNATHGFTAQDLIDMAEYSESDTAKAYAKRVQAVLNGEARTAFKDKKTGARNISARQGEILESRLSSEFSEKDRAAYTAAASDRMKQIDEKGTVTQSQREQFADILGRSAMGEDISRRDEKTVARNDVASQAALEMLTVGWADNADTYITGENSKLANVRRNRSVQKGQTVTVDGKEHKLSGIAVKDGKPYVKLTQKDGTASEMALSDIELDETTADLIENLTAKFGDKAQGAFSLYSGADTARYAAGLHQAVYSYAAEGVSLEAIKERAKSSDSLMHILNEQQIEWAYAVGKELHDSGQTKAKEKGQQNKEQRKGKTVKAEGKVSLAGAEGFGDAVRVSDLTAKRKKVLEAIQAMAKVTGFNYVLYDGKTNTFGAYQDGTIYVNINAARGSRNVVMATLSHELTHTLEQYAPEEYAELREAIKEKIIAERGAEAWELMIDAKIRREANNRKLSTEDAISEIVADGCEMMLKNSQAFKELAMEHTDLAEKLIGLLEDLISRIKDAFEDVTAGYRESQLLSDMEDIQQKWDAAFKEAVKQRNYEVGSVRENSHAEAVELVEEILTAPEITHVQARSIVKTEEMRKIFEQLTGISLDGLSNNKAQEAVLNYRDSGAKYASAFAEEAKFSVYDESLTKEIRRRISDTVEKAISEKGKLGIKYNQQRISRIPSNIVEIARIASGGKINLKGKFYALNGDYIYHEYNRHAVSDNDPKKIADELARHQIAFTKQRFKNAISCFLNPTMVECIYPDANNPTQNSAIAFAKKTTDGNYVIAVSVGGKNNPNICPMEIVYVDRQKWNAYIGKGKTISEMLYENSKAKIKTAIPFEYNKKNQVTAALIKAINSSDASLHSPQFADSVLQTEKEIKKNLQKSTWSEADEEYLRLAENPTENAAKIEKLVKQAAKEAMPYTKVLDKKGMPLVLYHGTTSKGQFHTFKDGMIFMFSRENYADQYTHTRGAVSVNPVQTGRVMPLFANITNPLVIDANRKLWKNIDVPWTTDKLTTDEIAAYAKEHKYDGVILKRVRDNMFDDDTGYCDEYIVFDKSQVKSSGPSYRNEKRDTFPWESRDVLDRAVGVTYDDNGNVIPLSERFNADNPDIRYSTWSEDEIEDSILYGIEDLDDDLSWVDEWLSESSDSVSSELQGIIDNLKEEAEYLRMEEAERKRLKKNERSRENYKKRRAFESDLRKWASLEAKSISEDYGIYNYRALLLPKTIKKYFDWFAASSGKYAQAYITEMSPVDYLKMTTGSYKEASDIIHQTEGWTADELIAKNELVPIQLVFDSASGKVVGHEGRHRMVALMNMGIKSVPVLMFDYSNKESKEYISGKEITGQFEKRNKAYISDLIPLRRQYEKEIMEKYSSDYQSTDRKTYKFSTWTEEELEAGVKEIGDSAIISDTGKLQLSISTYREGGRQILRDYLNDQVKSGAVSEADAADMLQQMETIYDICKKFAKDYALFGQWSEAEVVVDPVTHAPVFSVIKANGDYAMNLDFSLVCKKRRTLDAVFNEMIKQGIMDNFEMVEGSIAAINDIIRENGFETACALCFVDSKRYRQALVADSFVTIYNSFVRSLAKDGQTIDYHNFGGDKTIKNTGTGIDTLKSSELDFSAIDDVLKKAGKKTVEYKVAKYLKDHPEGRKLVKRGDFMSTAGFDTLKQNNPDILKLYNAKKGAGGPKAAQSDVQYMNDILSNKKFDAQKAFTVGGVRIQSFSDYMGRLIFDYVQMVADLAAKKMPAHAYTKEALFALQFGLTGIKTNMSLVPDVIDDGVAPGLDKNGNYAWRDGQSFGSTVYDGSEAFIKECLKIIGKKYTGQRRLTAEEGYQLALAIQNAKGYSTNCGTIAVGISDEHIRKMLRDPMIRMVIPYHKSSLNHIVAAMTNIDRYTDYTKQQNTRGADGKKLAKGKDTFNFNVTLQKLGDAKAAADAYLKWCDDHGYIPKFNQFRNEEGYYKLLEDFTCYDRNGVSVPQQAVKMAMPQAGDAFGDLKHMIKMGLEEDSLLQAKQDEAVPRIIDQIKTVLPKKEATGFQKSVYSDEAETWDADGAVLDTLKQIESGKIDFALDSIEIGTFPKIYKDLFSVGVLPYVTNVKHAYTNMVSKERAVADGKYTKNNKEHYRNMGADFMHKALSAVRDPEAIIDSWRIKKSPQIALVLNVEGVQEKLYGVIQFYARHNVNGGKEEFTHAVVTIYQRDNLPSDIAEAVSNGKLLYINKEQVTEGTDITKAYANIQQDALTANLAYFNTKLKTFKENRNISFSVYDDSLSDSIKEANERVLAYERIEKENRQLKSAVIKYKKMADYWKQQSEETKEVTVRESDVYALTKQLLDKMDSKADAKMIRDRLKGLLDMMEQSDEQQMEDMYDAFMEEAIDIGRTAAQEAWAVIDDSQADVNRELVSYMKDVTLLITDGDIHDANCESLKEFRAMIGKDVKVSRSKGQSVDQVYYELSHEYPYLFDEDITSAAEQIIAIANAIDDTAPVEGNPHEGHIGEVAMWFANDLMEAYLDDQIRQTAPTRADRYKAAINRAKSQNAELKRKAASDLKQAKADAKADTKAKVEAAKAKAKDRLDRQIERDADKLQRQAEKDEKRIRDIKDRLELLRMAKNERIEKIREEAAQRLAERDAKLKKEKWAAVKKVSDHYKQKEQNARDRRSRSSATAKIKKLYATIAGELAHPTETKHIPREYVQAMVTVLELINMDTISADRKIAGIDTEISGIRVQSQKDMDKISALNDKANRLRERDAKFKAAVDDLLKLYQSYKDNDRYPYIYEQQIADQLLKLYTDVGNTSLGTMTMDQLELVYRTLQMMYKLSKDALKMQIRDETYQAYEFSHELAQEVKDVPKSVKHLSAAKWLQTQLRPETMFHRLGGFKKNSYWDKYYRLLNDGQLKQTMLQMEMAKTFSDLLTDEKALKEFRSTKDGDLIDTGLVDSDGDAIMLTHDMAVSLYMNLLNEENMRHIAYGGMIVPELKDYMAGKDSLGFGTGMKQYLGIQRSIGEAMAQISDLKKQRDDMIASGTVDTQALDAIDSQIDSLNDSISQLELDAMTDMADLKDRLFDAFTDYDKAWIKQTQYLMDVQAKDYLNDTTMDVYGFERATVDNYYPLVVNKDLLRGSTEQIIQEMNLENVGFMKERIKSKKPINLLSVSDIVNMQIDRTAKYCGLMPALRTFNKVWGMTEQSSTDSLRLAIRRKFDQPAIDYVDRLLGDLTGTRKAESTTLGSFFDALRGNMAQATLTLNPRVAFAQAASYPTAAAVLGWDALAKGLSKGFLTETDRALIAKWSPLLWYRMQGFSTVELGDIRNSTTTQAEIWRKLKWATGWISAIDGGTVGKLWYASEYYVQDKFSNLQKGSDAYYEKVAEVFNDVVEKTQPNYTTMQRPDLLRNPNAVIKQFTMFMTQRLQNFNIVYDAAATYQKYKADYANSRNDVQLTDVQEAKKNLANAVSSQVVASAMIVGLKLAMDVLLHSMNAYRDDDDELTTQSILLAVLNNFLDTVFGNIAGGSEMYKYIYSLITGEKYYGISLNGVDTFTDLMSDTKSLVDALKSDKTPEQRSKTFNTWLKQLAQFAGIPLNNMEKIGFAFYYHGVDLINGELGSMEAGVDRSNKQNAHILYAALESGDAKKADAIWAEADNPDSLKSALLSYIKEMYTAGDLTAEQAVAKVQAYCGKDENDAYWTVQRWNYAAETGSTEGFSKNNRVMDAVIAGNDTEYKAAVQELTEHGTKESTIRSNIKSNVRDMLIGEGSLSEAEAKRILTKYCGLTATDASATVAAWKLQDSNKAYEGLTTDQVISYERTYELYGKPAGLSFDTTVSIIQWKNSQTADKDADGKAISGSLKKKVVEHIDAMSITDAQKDAMYMACGYADSTLGSTPWHKRK